MAVGVVATYNGSYHSPGFDLTVSGLSGYDTLLLQRIDLAGEYPDGNVRGANQVSITGDAFAITDFEAPVDREFVYRATAYDKLLTDSFTRTTSNGWGTDWTVNSGPASQFLTQGTRAEINLNSIDVTHTAIRNDISVEDVNVHLNAFFLQVAPTGAFIRGNLRLRYVDSANFLTLNVAVLPSLEVWLQIVRVDAGVLTSSTAVFSGVSATPGVSLHLRAEAAGTAVRGKVWRGDTNEPPAWQITAVDPTPKRGTVGMGAFLSPGNTNTLPVNVIFDELEILALGDDNVRIAVGTSSSTGVLDTFTREFTNGWGTPDTGPTWQIRDGVVAGFSAANNVGKVSISDRSPTPTNAFGRDYRIAGALTHADIDQVVKFRIRFTPTGDGIRLALTARETTMDKWWELEVHGTLTGQLEMRLGRWDEGIALYTDPVTITGVPFVTDQWYWARFRATGTDFKGRIWQDGTTEPVGWDLEFTDTANALPAGSYVGIRAFGSVFRTNALPELIEWDDYNVVLLDNVTSIPVEHPGVAWLKSVGQPALSRRVNISDFSERTRPGRVLAEYEVLGRPGKVVLTDVLGAREGTLTLATYQVGGRWESDSSHAALEALLANGGTLLLQMTGAELTGEADMFLEIKDYQRKRIGVVGGEFVHLHSISFVEVNRPSTFEESLALRDWQDVLDQNFDWGSVQLNHSTWLDVLQRDL